jgi:hypothetical protein
MNFFELNTYLWLALGVLLAGSIYLIVEGYKVNKIFADSIVGRLVKTLVAVLVVELYSLGTATYAFLVFNPKGTVVILPIVILLLLSLCFAIFSIRGAKREVVKLTN